MAQRPDEIVRDLLAGSSDGETARRRWLQILMGRFDASLAVCHNVGYEVSTETLRCTDVFCEGAPERSLQVEAALSGEVYDRHLVAIEKLPPMNGCGLYVKDSMSPGLWGLLWEPHGICGALGINAMREGRFAGHISLLRTDRAFRVEEASGEMRAWVRSSVDLLGSTHAMLTRGPASRGAILYHGDGSKWMQTQLVADWADDDYWQLLSGLVRRFVRVQDRERELHVHNTRINLDRLRRDGREALLLVVEPMRTPIVTELCKLSPTQRTVCAYVARGLTVEETARAMNRTASTIKTHLKAIYRRLRIPNRSELARLYESALDWRNEEVP